jgi:hypothetical protein
MSNTINFFIVIFLNVVFKITNRLKFNKLYFKFNNNLKIYIIFKMTQKKYHKKTYSITLGLIYIGRRGF